MAKVGIKDIAARAGVSIATVSNTLRNPSRVSEATRERVMAAVNEVGYTPNKLGVSLRTSRSHNIVVIIPDVSDSFNFGIIKAIERVAHQHGYSVLLGDTQGSLEREREYAQMARSRQADGIILFSHHLPFEIGKDISSLDEIPPLVNGLEITGIEGIPSVNIDNVQAAMDATQHLIDYGHHNIAVITGNMNSPSSQERLAGFRQAMSKAGLPDDDRAIVFADYTAESGELAAEKLLLHKDRPTAIFCFSDEIALGCIYTLREHGFQVPQDISVIGFDDIPFAKYVAPSLTTIAQPAAEIGATCAQLLMKLLDGKTLGNLAHILPHELIVRESTRRLQ